MTRSGLSKPLFSFEMEAASPFRLDLTVWALRRRPNNVVDRWDERTYRRVFMVQGSPAEVAIFQPDISHPTLHISVEGIEPTDRIQAAVTGVIERMLGTRRDCTGFYAIAAGNTEIGELALRFRGLKPPRFPSIFEALVNGIACQQLSLDVGIILLNRLAEATGKAMTLTAGVVHAFPGPDEVCRLTVDDLRTMGFSRQKARYLLDLAMEIADRGIESESFDSLDNAEISGSLQSLKGVGRWTAEYVLLRGLGRLDVFPGDDVGARKKLQSLLNIPGPLSYDGVKKLTEPWHPYAGFVYLHLLLAGLAAAGYLSDV